MLTFLAGVLVVLTSVGISIVIRKIYRLADIVETAVGRIRDLSGQVYEQNARITKIEDEMYSKEVAETLTSAIVNEKRKIDRSPRSKKVSKRGKKTS